MKENIGIGTVALTSCYYCGGGGDILIATRTAGGRHVAEAHGKVLNMEPCNKCKGYMELGVIVITIDGVKSGKGWELPPTNDEERKSWMPNPYRTGGWFVVSDDFIRKAFPEELVANVLSRRFTFIEHEVAEAMGAIS